MCKCPNKDRRVPELECVCARTRECARAHSLMSICVCPRTCVCVCPCMELRACLHLPDALCGAQHMLTREPATPQGRKHREGSTEGAPPTPGLETCGEASQGPGDFDVFYHDGDPRLSSRWTGDSAPSTRTTFLLILNVTAPPPRVALPSSQRGFTSVISFTCASVSQRGLWEPAGHRFTDSC